ncbi:uncharacterized protein LOC125289110 [Alosa alosa]|nr:uncharacterized protein LOC125289110 [Alosa alosa]
MKLWPDVSYVDIINYFVLSEGVDGETLRNYKSTEAYNYLHSNKIGKILCTKYNEFIFLKAEVEPSQSINKPKQLAWIMTRPIGIIETVGCSCIAGLGKSCSHAAAVIWKVQNAVVSGKTGLACTDTQRRWNEGTSKNLQPKRLSQIHFRHHKAEDEYEEETRAVGSQLPNTPQYQSHKDFRESVDKSLTKPLFLLKNTLLEKCYNATPSAEQQGRSKEQGTINDLTFLSHQNHDSDLSCVKCQKFYQAYVSMDGKQADTLELETRGQSASDLWHSSRKLRITASSAKKVPVREHFYPSFRGNYATNYGKEKEETACNQLKEQGMNITHTGTIVCGAEPWLSASPDGIINSCELLEMKCPVPNKNHQTLSELLSQRFSDFKVVDGKLEVQKTGSWG